jgi:hypothetical protein
MFFDISGTTGLFLSITYSAEWLRHTQRMDQARLTRKLLDWRPMGTRPVVRPRQRWQESVMEDLKKKAENQKLEGDS